MSSTDSSLLEFYDTTPVDIYSLHMDYLSEMINAGDAMPSWWEDSYRENVSFQLGGIGEPLVLDMPLGDQRDFMNYASNRAGTFYNNVGDYRKVEDAIINNGNRYNSLAGAANFLEGDSLFARLLSPTLRNRLQSQIDSVESYSALLPSLEGLQNSYARSGSSYINTFGAAGLGEFNPAGSLAKLIEKHNRYIYHFGDLPELGIQPNNPTRFKIGPLTYGPEVQDLRVIEDKSVVSIAAVRSDTDFLVDGGIGDADVEVTMMFSGEKHIAAGLRPLIALFKLSPITSVQNETITAILYDKFTENAQMSSKAELINAVDSVISANVIHLNQQELLRSVNAGPFAHFATYNDLEVALITQENLSSGFATLPGTPSTTSDPGLNLWETIQNFGIMDTADFATFTEWRDFNIAFIEENHVSRTGPLAGGIETTAGHEPARSEITDDTGDSSLFTAGKIDRTGHVPMAMVGLNIQVNPEMVDTLIVSLYLKRISVKNYLTEFLRYRDINGNPTPDARKAFWLNRAMQIYIDTYLDRTWVSSSLKTTELAYYGDNIELVWFMNGENLTKLRFSGPEKPTDYEESVEDLTSNITVNSLSYFISNKFAFHRLIGEAYPTAQYMGQSSGSLSMQLTAKGDEVLETVHTYKNAADFFSRHLDRLTRMNGWVVDCILTRLFNKSKDRTVTIDEGTEAGETARVIKSEHEQRIPVFFPKSIGTAVNNSSPGLRDINITFLQTDPDWFANFGFSIKQGSYDLDQLWKFTDHLYTEADKIKLGSDDVGWFTNQAFKTIYGANSSALIKTNFINSDTLVAGLLAEKTIKSDGTGFVKSYPDEEFRQIQLDITHTLLGDEFFSGLPSGARDLGIGEVIKTYFSGLKAGFSGLSFSDMGGKGADRALAERIAPAIILNWDVTDDEGLPFINQALKKSVINALDRLPTQEGRFAFYTILRTQPRIRLQDHYKARIFSSVMRRKNPPLDGIYQREGLTLGFDALITMFTYAGSMTPETLEMEGDDKAARNRSHSFSAMSKSRTLAERKINIDSEGRINRSIGVSTAYPDYPVFTFVELFDIPEEGLINNWMNYAYSFQDMGIINSDPDSYPSGDMFSVDSFVKAQKEKINDPQSPVPPSIFFWRKPELESAYNDLTAEMDGYFDQLSGMTLNLPYDIETAMRDDEGNIAGKTEVSEFVQAANEGNIDLDIERHKQWSTQIQSYGSRIAGYYGKQAMEDQFDQIGQAVLKNIQDNWSESGAMDDEDWVEMIRNKSAGYESLVERFHDTTNWAGALSGLDGKGINVPLLMYSHKESPVVKYVHMSGARGQAVLKSLVTAHLDKSGMAPGSALLEQHLNEQVAANAAGLTTAPTVSCGNESEMKVAMTKILQSIPDNKNDLIKAFPTFRLYFIEFQSPHIIVQDTMVGYNAIQSIDVTLDKHDADLAVIRIGDPFGLLQGTSGQIADVPYAATDDKNPDGEQVFSNNLAAQSESFFDRVQLKQGKAIQIRGGYSSEVDNLDIIFTGRVVEIQFGDIITIIAQGWKTDFIGQQVNFELNRPENTSVKDLVVKTIRAVNPSGIGVVMSEQEVSYLNTFVGGLAGLEERNQAYTQHVGTSASGDENTAAGMTGYGPWKWMQGLGRGLDLRLRNIWVPDRDSQAYFSWWGDITATGWDAERWVVPLQPGWEVLEAATNYCWGYICQVVPYDGEATLFFGRPDQLYFYTRGNHKDAAVYRSESRKSIDLAELRFIELFDSFLRSPHYIGIGNRDSVYNTWKGEANHYTYKGPNSEDDPDDYNPFLDILKKKDERAEEQGPSQRHLILPPQDRGWRNFYDWLHHDAEHHTRWSHVTNVGTMFDESSIAHELRVCGMDLMNDWSKIQEALGRETAATFMIAIMTGAAPAFQRQAWTFKRSILVDKLCAPLAAEQNTLRGVHGESQGYRLNELTDFLNNIMPDSTPGLTINEDHPIYGQDADSLREAWKVLNELHPDAVEIERTSSVNPGQSYDTKDTYAHSSSMNYGFQVKFAGEGPHITLEKAQEVLSLMNLAARIFTYRPQTNASETKQQEIEGMNQEVSGLNTWVNFIDQQHEITWNIYSFSALGTIQGLSSILLKAAEALQAGFINSSFTTQGRESEWVERGGYIQSAANADNADMTLSSNMANPYAVSRFKGFVHYFARFLDSEDLTANDAEIIADIHANNVFKWPSAINMKVFRDYHYIESGRDIIENNIAASTREMYNSVVVHYAKELDTSNDGIIRSVKEGVTNKSASSDYNEVFVDSGTNWATFPDSSKQGGIAGMQFNDQVSLANKRVAVYTDPSITRPDQAAKVATNVLTKMMRPMYRNNLLLTGRAIKPWDCIHLKDKYTDMSGPLDVERVVHHYNATTGWTTNIIPHAYCEANPGNKYVQAAVFANRMNKIMDIVDWTINVITVMTALPTLGASIELGVAARATVGFAIKQTTKRMSATAAKGFIGPTMAGVGRKRIFLTALKEGARINTFGGAKTHFMKSLTSNGVRALNIHFGGAFVQYTAGEVTDIYCANMGAGSDNLPVVFAPLLFKGIPLTAGMEANEYGMWSVGSKAYWSMRNGMEGLKNMFDTLGSDAGSLEGGLLNNPGDGSIN
jgi:hypothetical protein